MATSKNKDFKGSKGPKRGNKDRKPCIDGSDDIPYNWFPSAPGMRQLEYVRNLESEFQCLQKAFLALTTHFARMQFRLRQILQAEPSERDALLLELEKIAFEGLDESSVTGELPQIQQDLRNLGDIRRKQVEMIEKLRSQLTAYKDMRKMKVIVNAPERKPKTKPKPKVEPESELEPESDIESEKGWKVSRLDTSGSSDFSSATTVVPTKKNGMEWSRNDRMERGPSGSKRM